MGDVASPPKKRRAAAKPPPEGYVCKLCGVAGHWVYECAQSVRRPKAPKPAPAPPKPNPCVSTEEARVKCHCGLRAMKRRVMAPNDYGAKVPERRWVCAKLKKHKIKRGDADLRPCKFSRPVAPEDSAPVMDGAAAPAPAAEPDAPAPKRRKVNTRYLQRDKKRKAKLKLFVSGLPFGAGAAETLAAFFQAQAAEPPARVAALKKSDGRRTGQAYATFATADAAEAALALSGTKLPGEKGRWLEFKRVAEKGPEAAAAGPAPASSDAASSGGDGSSSSSGDES